ncbi:gas vesicle protein GvpG [Streptomyces alkaliphilus]|uniref:Gas vesicle protein n=1 Tax=Streptomyces alkaliphilus TaxID=1472722 RepID=A0A7W3T9S7_9ACTN|nr:gas vesicle protein GvpG [Streptomyces alkaliphilus]MBB0242886.1 gas vesicle protein [Streptomyces alkaliphilus]MQS06823.1 gas vesicle protein [Streptomyces alkaliphilus]
MGLLRELLLLPLAPVRGPAWIAEHLIHTAEREIHDPTPVLARLAELNRALDEGEIDHRSFEAEEERLLDELERRRRGRLLLPVSPPSEKSE